jgi:hypothetical protein
MLTVHSTSSISVHKHCSSSVRRDIFRHVNATMSDALARDGESGPVVLLVARLALHLEFCKGKRSDRSPVYLLYFTGPPSDNPASGYASPAHMEPCSGGAPSGDPRNGALGHRECKTAQSAQRNDYGRVLIG